MLDQTFNLIGELSLNCKNFKYIFGFFTLKQNYYENLDRLSMLCILKLPVIKSKYGISFITNRKIYKRLNLPLNKGDRINIDLFYREFNEILRCGCEATVERKRKDFKKRIDHEIDCTKSKINKKFFNFTSK